MQQTCMLHVGPTLTFLNCWLHRIRVCNATIDMVFILTFWNFPFERFGFSPQVHVDLWLYSITCFSAVYAWSLKGRTKKEISCFWDFEGFALNVDLFSYRRGSLIVEIYFGYDPVNSPKYANSARCLCLLDRHELRVHLSLTTISL